MNELEGMINGLMSNPEEMKKIMDIANSIMGGSQSQTSAGDGEAAPPPPVSAPSPNAPPGGLGSLLGNLGNLRGLGNLGSIAPTLGKAANGPALLASHGNGGAPHGDKAALVEALKPFLSETRRNKLDRASQLAKAMSMGLGLFGKGGGKK